MSKNDIELPPEFQSGNSVPVSQATIKRERMEEILRAAIEADRQQRGEPEGWQLVPKEPTAYMMFMGVACWNLHDDPRDDLLEIYRGMLEAAPKFGEEV